MIDENMAANIEEIANPTPETEVVETPETETATNDTDVKENEVVDITQTQAFAKRLKEEKQRAIDSEYSRLYGEEYDIHTKADYDKAIAQLRQQEEAEKLGIDPETINSFFKTWKESDPDFQELNTIRQQNNITKALTDLNKELKDIGVDLELKDLSDEEVAKLPNVDRVTELVSEGKTLAEAVFLANKHEFFKTKEQKTAQDTINKISANSSSSPGSLTNGVTPDVLTEEVINNMSHKERMNNWQKIKKFYDMK